MNAVEIVLTGPPRGKERVKRAQLGHSYVPDRTVNFESRMALAAQAAMRGRPLFSEALTLHVEMHFPVPASKPRKWRQAALAGHIRPTVKPDWDNGGKLTDALNLIVWTDDKLIVDARVLKFYSDAPRTVVRVTPLTEEGAFG